MNWLIAHSGMIVFIAFSVLSEILAILQYLKYPTNSGVGGVISGILVVLANLKKNQE